LAFENEKKVLADIIQRKLLNFFIKKIKLKDKVKKGKKKRDYLHAAPFKMF